MIDAKSTPPSAQPIGGMMIALTSVVTTRPERGADDDADGQREGVASWSGTRGTLPRHASAVSARRPSAGPSPRRSSRRPRPRSGTRRTMPGRAATTSWNVIARLAALRLRELGGRVDAGGLEQVGVLRADAVDPHQVDVVDPLEDELAADPGRVLERLPAGLAWRPAGAAASVVVDAGLGELGGLRRRRCPRPRRSSSRWSSLVSAAVGRARGPMIRLPAAREAPPATPEDRWTRRSTMR